MRTAVLLFLFLLLPGTASLAAQPLGAAPAKPAAEAPAPAPAIIPGSPLAALANATAAAPAPAAEEAAAPFGTRQVGFVITTAIGGDTIRAMRQFGTAVHNAIRLAPVIDWLTAATASPVRRAEAKAILIALLTVVLPAALADALLRLALRQPAARCAQMALRPQEPPPEEPSGAASGHARRAASLRGWGRRLTFALLKLLIAALPLAGFILTALVLLTSGVAGQRAAVLGATGVGNAYFVCRIVQELARFLFSPAAPSLRLIAMPTGRAQALMRWLLIVLATIFFAASLISCALVLGLPHEGAQVLIRFAALAVHLEAAVGIWQCRALVGGWIAGDPLAGGSFAWLRRRLGRWWHYVALFYVMALWLAWTGGVQNAFIVMLRSILVLVTALAVGGLAWKGSVALLERLLAGPATGSARHPTLQLRIGVYRPLLSLIIRVVITTAMLLLILQGWGFDALDWLRHNTISQALLSLLTSIFVISVIALSLWEAVNFILLSRIEGLTAAGRRRQASRLRTLAPILRGTAGTIIAVLALLVCLSRIGVNTTGLLAVSSIAGIAIGFGSQKLVQDIITGLFMLLEDAVQVGDVVTLAGMSGTVERLSIRTIHLRGGDGSINIIPFSAVTTITNSTRDFSYAQIAITVGYDEDLDHVNAVLTDIGRDMRAEPTWAAMIRDDLQIFGLDKFGERGLVISGQIRTAPGQSDAVRREFFRRVQQRFRADGIDIPYQQSVFRLEMPPAPAAPETP